jgi:hypothetical protein
MRVASSFELAVKRSSVHSERYALGLLKGAKVAWYVFFPVLRSWKALMISESVSIVFGNLFPLLSALPPVAWLLGLSVSG